MPDSVVSLRNAENSAIAAKEPSYYTGSGRDSNNGGKSGKSPNLKGKKKGLEFGKGEGKVPLKAIAERAKRYQPKPKITYKMIQEYVEKKYGFKVHTAYIAEVKRSLGLMMYDASNAAGELQQPRKHLPKEKADAIMEALKYFGVI